MKSSSLMSILIPVYKTERYLPRCLDSLVAQTDGDFEAIVVDDCSPGNCREIVARYDSRFRYVRHEKNLSLLQARLTGLRAAQGDYVIPLDSDDYVMPGLLATLKKEIDSAVQPSTFNLQPSPDVIVYQMMYDDGKKITKTSVRYRDERLSAAEALDRFFASRIQCGICGKAIRREIYLKAMDQLAVSEDFYLNSSEDLCQTFPVLLNARTVSTLAYPGYRYWSNGDSLTQTLTDPARLGKAAENTRRVFDVLAEFVRRNGHDLALLSKLGEFQRPTLRWYLSSIRHQSETEWRACAAELCKHFEPALVAREAMLLIEESTTFRLGRTLLHPVKRLLGK